MNKLKIVKSLIMFFVVFMIIHQFVTTGTCTITNKNITLVSNIADCGYYHENGMRYSNICIDHFISNSCKNLYKHQYSTNFNNDILYNYTLFKSYNDSRCVDIPYTCMVDTPGPISIEYYYFVNACASMIFTSFIYAIYF